MPDLFLHNRKVDSVFQLLGDNEDDISYSVAWALANCPTFLDAFLRTRINRKVNAEQVLIRLQQSEKSGGITDIEIENPGIFYIIIEAKRGWKLPGLRQLQLYAERSSFKSSKASTKLILALSECSQEYATANLDPHEVSGVPIEPISWKDVAILADKLERRLPMPKSAS